MWFDFFYLLCSIYNGILQCRGLRGLLVVSHLVKYVPIPYGISKRVFLGWLEGAGMALTGMALTTLPWSRMMRVPYWINVCRDSRYSGFSTSFWMIFTALPLSRLLNGWTIPRGDSGSSVSPVSPLPSQRLLRFPSCNDFGLELSISWKSYSSVWLCTSENAIDGDPVSWRELVGCLEASFLGPIEGWDFSFLRISSIKVDRPRVTGPLVLLVLGSGLGFFSAFFYLVMHTNKIYISTQNNSKYIGKRAGEQGFYMLRTQVLTFLF